MPQVDNAVERNFPAGQFASGNFNLPAGAREIILTLSIDTWPDVSDGTITLALLVSRGQGAPFVQEWADGPFLHKSLFRNGVKQTQARFGAALQSPFGAEDRVRYEFTSTVDFRSAVQVDANVIPFSVQG
jgi:hypothetical protein